ncbi:MAG TPA: CRISPR-associated helicase Cas3' [Burkholderiaceae bacterium]|nr:CRISPR-associated helicase Cas3' [Burkholderiaceae bacterium]
MSATDLTQPYFLYWGKARPSLDDKHEYHLLPYHCLDVAAVGMEYLRRAPAFCRRLMQVFNTTDVEAVVSWAGFAVALHDIGKFSESFQAVRQDVFLKLRSRASERHGRVRHDTLGMAIWNSHLLDLAIERSWFGPNCENHEQAIGSWMRSVTGHHGQPPNEIASVQCNQHFHAEHDLAAICAFVQDARSILLTPAAEALLATTDAEWFEVNSKRFSWWIAGWAVFADWLGSSTDYFKYEAGHVPLEKYWARARAAAQQALDEVGVLPVSNRSALSIHALFPSIAVASPLQAWAADVPLALSPQIHLLEDTTGAGKTEAAVMLAQRLIADGLADGFYIGLPTMATANAMYGRIAQVYGRFLGDEASLVLANGQSALVEAFAASIMRSGKSDAGSGQLDDTATARCTAWLADHHKRALLAPAGVGTVDQAMLSVLHSRHQSLRLLGLFRKVLIIDEVHACDAYMLGVLKVLLEFHAYAGGSAILLSATLPLRMKRELLQAFARGCEIRGAPEVDGTAYPLATSWASATPERIDEHPVATRHDVIRSLRLNAMYDERQVVQTILARLNEGRCVCWMRNTVGDALAAYELLSQQWPTDKITLFHARFALRDRLDIEKRILHAFGRDSGPEQRRGQLVIATQVVEQSLDADWDVVVTDLAPIDRLIQRAGRLQRHARDTQGARLTQPNARDERGEPCLHVFMPEWAETPAVDWFKKVFPKAAHVYPHHGQCWKTARLVREERWSMPGDARRLIENVFGTDHDIPEALQKNADSNEGKAYGDAAQAQQNSLKLCEGYVSQGFDWWNDAVTPSRNGEATSNVVLARWRGDALEPWAAHEELRHAWAYSAVRVPERLIAQSVEPVEPNRRAAWEQAIASLPGQGRFSVLMALDERDERWVGEAKGRAGRDLETWTWMYDKGRGLLRVDKTNQKD